MTTTAPTGPVTLGRAAGVACSHGDVPGTLAGLAPGRRSGRPHPGRLSPL
ncbi:MAG: hypothetical protein LBJ87_15350 [bacterium]|nr:hypothetical protein [bacterium]